MNTEPQANGALSIWALPQPMGWAIMATYEGENYTVEVGVKSASHRIAYWNRNIQMVRNAIAKKLATPTA